MSKLFNDIMLHNNIVFFGGAGVSTASGIPDFRSENGLYNTLGKEYSKYSPEYLLSKDCLDDEPEVFFKFYKSMMDTRKIEPNITHKVLVKLEKINKLKSIITQNIDGLHQKAGSLNVKEIHGSALRCTCIKCKKHYNADVVFDSKDNIPHCECGGIIRPDITLYGELLPNAFYQAEKDIKWADMLIIAGTSLTVYPAANLVNNFTGNTIYLINRDNIESGIKRYKNLEVHSIKDDMANVFRELGSELESVKDKYNFKI